MFILLTNSLSTHQLLLAREMLTRFNGGELPLLLCRAGVAGRQSGALEEGMVCDGMHKVGAVAALLHESYRFLASDTQRLADLLRHLSKVD